MPEMGKNLPFSSRGDATVYEVGLRQIPGTGTPLTSFAYGAETVGNGPGAYPSPEDERGEHGICPMCGRRLVVSTTRRVGNTVIRYIACRRRRGSGCGYIPEHNKESAFVLPQV